MIAVVDYGMGNLRSVARALRQVGGRSEVTDDPVVAARADALVIPGVGAFGACMHNLRASGLDRLIGEFRETGRPILATCLGMQVLFDGSEEGQAAGLGLVRGSVKRLPDSVKVPHMGWNEVEWTSDHPFIKGIPSGTRFYFVHSYAVDGGMEGTVGTTEYGGTIAAVMARENVFATQFHPEKSSEAGLALYDAFVREVG